MDLKAYFDVEIRTTLVYTAVAIVMGYVSFVINHTAYAAVAAILVMVVATFAMRFIWKIKEGAKWWLANGGIVYLFLWIITWTIFYNTYLI